MKRTLGSVPELDHRAIHCVVLVNNGSVVPTTLQQLHDSRMTQDNYNHPRFLELADQIENHSRAISYLMEELRKEFPPPPGDYWGVAEHRPLLLML
jgi:hypothetical protein